MTHKESTVKVFFTNEYGRFKTINGNRQLNNQKINRIIKDINNGIDVLKFCPIIVSEKKERLEIIDGQHRFFVAKKMKSQVWYIIASDMTLMEIAKINSNTERWKDKDFINCYIQQDNENYKMIQQFMDDTGFPLSTCLQLLYTGTMKGEGGSSTHLKPRFISGTYEVKDLAGAQRTSAVIKLFKDFDGHTQGAFCEAICRILRAEKIDIKDLHKKWQKDPKQLTKRSSVKEYLVDLETIYNQSNRIRKVIF